MIESALLHRIASEYGLPIYQEDSFDLVQVCEVLRVPQEAAVRSIGRDSGLISFTEFRHVVVHAAPELLGKLWLLATDDSAPHQAVELASQGPADLDIAGLITQITQSVVKGMGEAHKPDTVHALRSEGYRVPDQRTLPEKFNLAVHEYRSVEGRGITVYEDKGLVLVDWRAVSGKKGGPFKAHFPALVQQPDWRGWRDHMDELLQDYRLHVEKFEFYKHEDDEDPIDVDHERPLHYEGESLEEWHQRRPPGWTLDLQKEEQLVELIDMLLPTLSVEPKSLNRFSAYVFPTT